MILLIYENIINRAEMNDKKENIIFTRTEESIYRKYNIVLIWIYESEHRKEKLFFR
jgi:hypothetical protein